ncbi:MAG: fluoride efflux transporter CrcB [Bacteroidaceae bacterium]|nr:fluoride efflux transporter CrcB [Bacteroidaceae bacterium]
MKTVLLVFLGGGCGSVLRYLINIISTPLNGHLHFPLGTLVCNIVGCFLIGLFGNLAGRMGWEEQTKLMLTVGLCGGFTTFSTFSNESLQLIHGGHYVTYALYLLLSIVLGIGAVILGMKC